MRRLILFSIIAGLLFVACEMDKEIKYRGEIEKNRIYIESVLSCHIFFNFRSELI